MDGKNEKICYIMKLKRWLYNYMIVFMCFIIIISIICLYLESVIVKWIVLEGKKICYYKE